MYRIVKKERLSFMEERIESFKKNEKEYEEQISYLKKERDSNHNKISRLQRDKGYLKDLLRKNNIQEIRSLDGLQWRLIKFRLQYRKELCEPGIIGFYPGRSPDDNDIANYWRQIEVKSAVTLKEWPKLTYLDLITTLSRNQMTSIIESISEVEFDYLKSALLDDPKDKVIYLWRDPYADDHDIYVVYAIEVSGLEEEDE